jgi:hypothetical protein
MRPKMNIKRRMRLKIRPISTYYYEFSHWDSSSDYCYPEYYCHHDSIE